jgi:hypothetical protein
MVVRVVNDRFLAGIERRRQFARIHTLVVAGFGVEHQGGTVALAGPSILRFQRWRDGGWCTAPVSRHARLEYVRTIQIQATVVRRQCISYEQPRLYFSSRDATWVSAWCKRAGNGRPRSSARRRIPRHAFGLKKYFRGTSVSKTSDNEHAAPALGDSEILSVKNPPGDAIPAFDQLAKDDSEVGSSIAG